MSTLSTVPSSGCSSVQAASASGLWCRPATASRPVDRVWVPFDAERVRAAPKASGGELTQADELALLAHYGLAGPAGRAGELTGRDPGSITARPA